MVWGNRCFNGNHWNFRLHQIQKEIDIPILTLIYNVPSLLLMFKSYRFFCQLKIIFTLLNISLLYQDQQQAEKQA